VQGILLPTTLAYRTDKRFATDEQIRHDSCQVHPDNNLQRALYSEWLLFVKVTTISDRLCGLVVSVDYKHRGPVFDSRELLRIFLRELGLERGPLSLVIG
jgi:hypothetical protein